MLSGTPSPPPEVVIEPNEGAEAEALSRLDRMLNSESVRLVDYVSPSKASTKSFENKWSTLKQRHESERSQATEYILHSAVSPKRRDGHGSSFEEHGTPPPPFMNSISATALLMSPHRNDVVGTSPIPEEMWDITRIQVDELAHRQDVMQKFYTERNAVGVMYRTAGIAIIRTFEMEQAAREALLADEEETCRHIETWHAEHIQVLYTTHHRRVLHLRELGETCVKQGLAGATMLVHEEAVARNALYRTYALDRVRKQFIGLDALFDNGNKGIDDGLLSVLEAEIERVQVEHHFLREAAAAAMASQK
eukprot:PhM_4_TR5307/c0_g1_i1/m.58163